MRRTILWSIGILMLAGVSARAMRTTDDISAKAKKLHFSSIVIDTHDDTTQRLLEPNFDIGAKHDDGSIDIPRMKEGGLGGIFFSIWMDEDHRAGGGAEG